jgi:hypothetical protein
MKKRAETLGNACRKNQICNLEQNNLLVSRLGDIKCKRHCVTKKLNYTVCIWTDNE